MRDYPRDLFNTAQPVSGATPLPNYDPYRLDQLYDKRHEIQLQMFDLINEAALRHDKRLMRALDLYGPDLGPIPSLAAAHYKWVFGDKSQLDWLLAKDQKRGFGATVSLCSSSATWMNGTEPFGDSRSMKPISATAKAEP